MRHLLHVVVKEAGVGDNRIGGQRLLARAAGEARSRLIEGDMTVGANAADEKVDASCGLDHLLVVVTLCLQVLGITVEDMDILGQDVNMIEEVAAHERVVALWMILGEPDILIHVERDDVAERHTSLAVGLDQLSIHSLRRRAGWKSEHEGTLLGRSKGVDTLYHMASCPCRQLLVIAFDD